MDLPCFQEWKENKELPLVGLFCGHLIFSSWSMLGKWSDNKLILQVLKAPLAFYDKRKYISVHKEELGIITIM